VTVVLQATRADLVSKLNSFLPSSVGTNLAVASSNIGSFNSLVTEFTTVYVD
jgi:hypothetical protein